jgi:hypothetical protein
MFCTNCGASNMDDAKFCVNCGESFNENRDAEKSPRPRGLRDVSVIKKIDFFRPLFDFSFNQFVTSKILKFLYSLSILAAGLMAILFVVFGFNISIGFGLFALLVGAPVIFLLTMIYSRVSLEIIILIFRIAENTAPKAEKPEPKDSIQWNV